MSTLMEKIADIEKEISKTQKNKATNAHLCLLRAKLARYRSEIIEGPKTGGPQSGEGFDVMKSGDARVAMIGFPSVGKSSTLAKLTNTASTAAAYEFTTLTCIPGVLQMKDAKIQLLDLPGIIEGASKGKGRGRQVIGVARTSNLILMMLDAEKADLQRRLLTKELDDVGIRLNKKVPDIGYTVKKSGGVTFSSLVHCTEMDADLCKKIVNSYKVHHAHVLFRENATADDLIDVIEGNRKYLPCLYVVNKVDNIFLDEVERLAYLPHHVVCSIREEWNLPHLLNQIWEHLDLLRVYTKPRGKRPDFSQPLIMRRNSTIEHVCHKVHRSFASRFKYALVWGASAKHEPQRVGLQHFVEDGDVVQLVAGM